MVFRRVEQVPLEFVLDGEVDADLTAALKAYFTRHGDLTDTMAEEAEDFFHDLKARQQWLACDCEESNDVTEVPLLDPVEGMILRRHPVRTIGQRLIRKHDEHCVFVQARGKLNSDGDNTQKFVEPERRPRLVNSFSLVRSFRTRPPDGNGHLRTNPGSRRERTRSSTHAHLLLTLLDRAKLNRWDYNATPRNLSDQYTAIRDAAADLDIGDDLKVGDLIISTPKLIGRADDCEQGVENPITLRQKIASKARSWPNGSRPHGFLCTRVAGFAEGLIDFGLGHYKRKMENKPHVFAECRDVMTGPYIALISYACRTPNDTLYEPYGCFAQPCLASDDCAPVDSSFEKRTLEYLRSVQKSEKRTAGVRFNILKPLFDISVRMEDGSEQFCRPDFILEVLGNDGRIRRKIVVETMGLQDDEYEASKNNTHPRMRRIDDASILVEHVVTETPPELTPNDSAFFRRLYVALRENRETR